MKANGKLIALVSAFLTLGTATVTLADEKAPMPQTKGMQGMDPALHDKWAEEGKQDRYKDCTPDPEKAAQQREHPMPQTKGMQGMDPTQHTVDCPEPKVAKPDPDKPPKHVHKAPGGG